tara:strand:- start:125915 stop:127714 length:1800 start_codon:yes stop_codon:yes gene_type:complete
MIKKENDFVIHVATVNGSGSQSSNSVLVKSLFRMGLGVSGKNMFPSNIAGLPTWFTIRISEKRYAGRNSNNHLVVAMNPSTVKQDIDSVANEGYFIYNSDMKFDSALLRDDVTNVGISYRSLIKGVTDSVKLKKLLVNMIYAGVVAELIGIPEDVIETVVTDQFSSKPGVVESNLKAIATGREYAKENLEPNNFGLKVKPIDNGNEGKILIDGNTATALGFMYGGCTFLSWYPITPSSSITENFEFYAKKFRQDESGANTFAVVQAEDELSAISMVIGAGWTGARAATCTSGPGLSLMAEAAGLSYFAEVPAVIWNVQRGGPSTGLPTRTQQGDLLSSVYLSHGDTEHVVLLPTGPEECFEFGQTCFDVAESLQTLVVVLSDLDTGMNLWISDELKPSSQSFQRGKVLREEDLKNRDSFERYGDVDGDAIPYRTLPGTHHPLAGYFTRGTGHKPDAGYSEDNEVYRDLQLRLKRKRISAKEYLPQPVIDSRPNAKIGIIAYGSTDAAIPELRDSLATEGVETNYLRVRAFPFDDSIEKFIEDNDTVYVVEQNRDGQLHHLIQKEWPHYYSKLKSICQFDGLPLEAKFIQNQVMNFQGAR